MLMGGWGIGEELNFFFFLDSCLILVGSAGLVGGGFRGKGFSM